MKIKISTLCILAITYIATCMTNAAYAAPNAASLAKLPASDISRQTLPANDGWGATGSGTTGGSTASAGDIYTVSTRKQFVDALSRSGNDPKIIRIQGTINLSTDDSGRELFEKDYADSAHDFEAYKKAYDPAQWNRQPLVKGRPPKATGPLEDARMRSWANQKRVIQVLIPSNTTLIGIGADAKIIKGNLYLNKGESNIIIRNIAFEDAFDYFPMWNPEDSYNTTPNRIPGYSVSGCQDTYLDDANGPHRCNGGRWNSEYDNISIKGATHVWIDHCSFSDGERLDKLFPPNYAAPYNQPEQKIAHHDGLLDITNESNYITVSHSHFYNHDKSLLVGGSDNAPSDEGKLKVTFRHNLFENLRQRQPLIRYGQVHSFNNLYIGARVGPPNVFSYLFGLGTSTKLLSENNVFELGADVTAPDLLYYYGSSKTAAMLDKGSLLNGSPVDVVAAFNEANPDKHIPQTIGWVPSPGQTVLPSTEVAKFVKDNVGAGKL